MVPNLKRILEDSGAKGIIIHPSAVDWNAPLLQRPHHLALHLARRGWLFFYCSSNDYDKASGLHIVTDRLYVTSNISDLLESSDKFVIIIYSTSQSIAIRDIENFKHKALIVYDYLDEIHPSLSDDSDKLIARHNYLIKNSDIVTTTAERLYLDVKQSRQSDLYLLPNGADYAHFHIKRDIQQMPPEIKKIKQNGKPIVGYFGALASWFDYKLLQFAASKRSDLEFVLIGWDYRSIGKIGMPDISEPNIHYLGVKDYSILPNYAIWFDVCILPFIINDITKATSPIKLFEYMALGKPTVATPLDEAMRYKSVLIADDPLEFVEKIGLALNLTEDKQYLELIDQEAKMNTWDAIFSKLDKILSDGMVKKGWGTKSL